MTSEVRERYLAAMARVPQCTSELVRPATDDELAELRRVGLPEPVLDLMRLAVLDSWYEGWFIFGEPEQITRYTNRDTDEALRPRGFIPIGSNIEGDLVILDTHSPLHADGLPRVLELSHEWDWSRLTIAQITACWEIAPSFLEFIEQLAGIRPGVPRPR